jgi:hypothetical protein
MLFCRFKLRFRFGRFLHKDDVENECSADSSSKVFNLDIFSQLYQFILLEFR